MNETDYKKVELGKRATVIVSDNNTISTETTPHKNTVLIKIVRRIPQEKSTSFYQINLTTEKRKNAYKAINKQLAEG